MCVFPFQKWAIVVDSVGAGVIFSAQRIFSVLHQRRPSISSDFQAIRQRKRNSEWNIYKEREDYFVLDDMVYQKLLAGL